MSSEAATRTSLRERIESHLGSRDVARVIYGAVVGLAFVVALQAHPPSAGSMTGLLIGTALAVALAELYSEFVSAEARARRPLTRSELRTLAEDTVSVFIGAGFPAVFFALAALGVLETKLAFTLAKWSGLGLICVYGFLAARLAGATVGRGLRHAVAVGLIGGAVIALKSIFH